MRNSRLVVGLVAVACAAALPAVAAAHNGQPQKAQHGAKAAHGHPGKGRGGDPNSATVRLAPAAGQTAKGVAELQQRTGALSVALVVSHLTPGAFYAAHVHAGTCAAPGAVALTLPDVYADEHGVAKLVTTLPTAAAADYVASGFSVDVHAGPSASPSAVISCGDVTVKAAKTSSKAWLKGTTAKGHAEAVQKGSDVTVWVTVRGLTPGVHAFNLLAGTCAAPGAVAVSLGDITAGPDGVATAKIAATSSTPVLGTGFSFGVYTGATTAPGAVVACGDQSTWFGHGHK
jgi:hypothetical protein